MHVGVFVETWVVVALLVCQIVEVEVQVVFAVEVWTEEGFWVWVEVCPAHVVVTVFVLVDLARLARAFLLVVGQAVAEAVLVEEAVDHFVLVDVQVEYEVATVWVTVVVALTVMVMVVVLAGLVMVDVVVIVVVAGGVMVALWVEVVEVVLDGGGTEAPHAPDGSMELVSRVTAAVSA